MGARADTDDRLYEAVHDVAQWYVLHDRSARLSGVMSPQDLLRFQTVGQRVVRRQVGNACPHAAVHLRIELIGSRLLNRDAEVSVLRHVRDDLLATTGPGREWIALFERAQTPLMAMLLGDQRLSDMAANLVESAGRLAGDERSTPTEGDVERGLLLIRELIGRTESDEVRADLNACR